MVFPQPVRIVIVEDNSELRDVLSGFIQSSEGLKLVNSYSACEPMLKNLLSDKPGLVLMDIGLPGMSGIEGTAKIKAQLPNTEVIIITVFENSESVFLALQNGASGYLTKNLSKDELISSLQECLNGGAPMSMKIAKMVVGSFKKSNDSPLSQRETEVLENLAKGKSYHSIADTLFVTKDTVKFHIKNIYFKLQVSSREEAIETALRQKLI